MKITKDTYEAFLLDYAEGNLSPEESTALFAFLDAHPELDVDTELDIDFQLDDLPLHFEHKDGLKKEIVPVGGIHEGNFEEAFVADIDGESAEDVKLFLDKNEFLKADYARLTKMVLPVEFIEYPHKASLRKSEPRVVALWQWAAAAASVALLVFFLADDGTAPQYAMRTGQPITPVELNEGMTDDVTNDVITDIEDDVKHAPAESVPSVKKKRLTSEPPIQIAAATPKVEPKVEKRPELQLMAGLAVREVEEMQDQKSIVGGKRHVRKVKKRPNVKEQQNDWLGIAFKGFNKLFKQDVKLDRSYNDNGELVAYAVKSKALDIFHKRGE